LVVRKATGKRSAFDNGSLSFRFDSAPVVIEPSFDGFELLSFERVGIIGGGFGESLEFDAFVMEENPEVLGIVGAIHPGVRHAQVEFERRELAYVREICLTWK